MQSWRDTFRKVDGKLLFGAFCALLLLGVSGVLSFRNASHLIAVTGRVKAIHATIADERELLAQLNQAESGLFGYVITADTNFLTPYHSATSALPALVQKIHDALDTHADALAELPFLETLIDARVAQMRHRIEVAQTDNASAAALLIKSGEAKRVMDQIRLSIAKLTEHEQDRLRAMDERSMASAHRTLVVDVISGTLSVLLLAAILTWLMREVVTRRATEEELRKAGRQLEDRVEQRTADLAKANASLQKEIIEHKQAEEALRASEQKLADAAAALADKNKDLEMLVYVVSHDLRAPLVNIRGFVSELLRDCKEVEALAQNTSGDSISKKALTPLLQDFPESAAFIQAGVTKMDSLLGGFLRLSRLGRAAIRLTRVDMSALFETVAQSLAFQFREAGAEIEIERSLPRCMGDVAQLTHVFSNIIENAVKYRDPERALRVRVSATVENGNALYRVEDNGRGIPAEHLQRVFEIFHRVNPRESEGEGLGLTIAKRIVDRLNGRITVDSKAGEGSVFAVSLPLAQKEDGAKAAKMPELEGAVA